MSEFGFEQVFEQGPAIRDLAGVGMDAMEFELLDDSVIDAEQTDQRDFFFFTLGAGLLQQRDSIAALDEAFASVMTDALEIVIPHTSWVMARHGAMPLNTTVFGIRRSPIPSFYKVTRTWAIGSGQIDWTRIISLAFDLCHVEKQYEENIAQIPWQRASYQV